jgi:cbb3-type cytochrome oxidase subunit 3
MKFKNYLEQINGVEVYPMISLILFTGIFIAVLFYVFTADKKSMNDKASIPLN